MCVPKQAPDMIDPTRPDGPAPRSHETLSPESERRCGGEPTVKEGGRDPSISQSTPTVHGIQHVHVHVHVSLNKHTLIMNIDLLCLAPPTARAPPRGSIVGDRHLAPLVIEHSQVINTVGPISRAPLEIETDCLPQVDFDGGFVVTTLTA